MNCSQDIVLKLTTFEDLMISNGSGPFIDIYKQGSYELTLMWKSFQYLFCYIFSLLFEYQHLLLC